MDSVRNVASILPDANGERNPRNSLLHSLLAAEDPRLFGNFLMRRVIQVPAAGFYTSTSFPCAQCCHGWLLTAAV